MLGPSVDAGLIISPDGLINQIEGGIIQSASWTLHEQIRFDRDGITSRDWTTYPIMTMPDVPKVETVLLNRPNDRPLGAGEASQGPTVAAIANAFAAATGRRHRDLPFTRRGSRRRSPDRRRVYTRPRKFGGGRSSVFTAIP